MRHVIIGNSAAGIGCAEGIRKISKTDEIIIISDEKYHTYSRPLISYLLEGKTDEQRMKYRSDDFYDKNNITFMPCTAVTAINPKEKTVTTDDSQKISYDKLMYAAGSSPFVPKTEGAESVEKSFTFMTLNDALYLKQALNKDSRVLIIGAGLIGLKCAEGIKSLCGEITVADMADRILSSILDCETSSVIRKHIENNGINFILNDYVVNYDKNTAHFKSGKSVDFDVLVTCVGVRPRTELLSKAGAEVNKGIVINEKSETSIEDIYSAGDCAECTDISSGQKKILALLPNAYKQGETAGINMAGGNKSFSDAIPMNAIGFFGLHMITAGTYDGETWTSKSDDNGIKRLYYKDNLLKGYILIKNIEKAGIYTSLIKERTPLDSIDFNLIKETPGLMAFSEKYRNENLGGVKIGY